MSVNAIASSTAPQLHKTPQANSNSQKNSVSTAAQEAAETPAQTAREAQKGDKVAIRKLQQQQQKAAASQPKASEPGKGEKLDHEA